MCYNASHPRSARRANRPSPTSTAASTFYVPPGPAFVYINASVSGSTLEVPGDRDPDPVVLKQGLTQPAEPRLAVECEVRVRVWADANDPPVQKRDRNLSGRVFDKRGSPLVGVQVYYNREMVIEGATDRRGLFRLEGLPHGPLQLGLRRNADQHGWVRIPAEAAEVDLIFPQ